MLKINFRPALNTDIFAIMNIIADAKCYLHQCGVDQWQDGFPNEAVIAADIADSNITREPFVVTVGCEVAAYVCLSMEKESAYSVPVSGKFMLPGEYCTIHRTAVNNKFRGEGLSHLLFDICSERCAALGVPNLRVDTHRDNARMRHIIIREGFTERAVVTLENGGERIAYEKRVII